jgi:hypothetical protein
MIDKIFKIGMLFLAMCLLWLLFVKEERGHYQMKMQNAHIVIFDTQTGKFYATSAESNGKWSLVDPKKTESFIMPERKPF